MDGQEPMRRRVRIGALISAALGIFFGMGLIVCGSFMTWQSDPVLGIYVRPGVDFKHVVAGDGRITLVLGAIGVLSLIAGAIFVKKTFFAIPLVFAVVLFGFSVFELTYLFTRQGVVAPGNGLYAVFGGTIAAFLCSLSGYLMTSERDADLKAAAQAIPGGAMMMAGRRRGRIRRVPPRRPRRRNQARSSRKAPPLPPHHSRDFFLCPLHQRLAVSRED